MNDKILMARIRLETAESGATMVEYGVILAMVSIAAVAVLAFVGGDVLTLFTRANNAMP